MQRLKNSLLSILAKCINKIPVPRASSSKHSKTHRKKILIISTTGLGDTLWGTPSLQFLKEQNPNCHLTVLTSPIGEALLKHNPNVDEIFTISNPALAKTIRLIPILRKKQFDTVIIFHCSQRPIFALANMLRAKETISTEKINKGLDSLFTKLLKKENFHEIKRRIKMCQLIENFSSHNSTDLPDFHTSRLSQNTPNIQDSYNAQDSNSSSLNKLKIEQNIPYQMKIFYTKEEEKKALANFNHPFLIAMHFGAKDKFKQWPKENFIYIANKLCETYSAKIVLTGSSDETADLEKLSKQIKNAAVAKLPVRQTSALLKHCKLMLTNDTGPMHIAFSEKTPTIALFAPTDPMLCGPYKISQTVIKKSPTCYPCLNKKCKQPICMAQISKEEVWKTAKSVLSYSTGTEEKTP